MSPNRFARLSFSALAGVTLFSAPLAQADPAISSKLIATGFSSPLFVTAPAGDTSHLFVVDQGSGGTAQIKVLNLGSDTVNATPFLTISGIATGGEQGLLGLAFDP